MGANTMRISGLNSGLDTEALVKAMTASTMLKITKQQRNVLKLNAQQEAYQTIIEKMNSFKSKYMNLTNMSTYLRSPTLFTNYSPSISKGGEEYKPSGVSVTTSPTAQEGSYSVTLKSKATQTTVTGNKVNGNTALAPDDFQGGAAGLAAGESYAVEVSVGTGDAAKKTTLMFNGSANEADMLDDLNNQLRDAYGVTNSGTNLVSIGKNAQGKYEITSKDYSAISVKTPVKLNGDVTFGVNGDSKTGGNSINITVNGETRTISYYTVANDYFDGLVAGPGDTDADGDGYIDLDADATAAEKTAYNEKIALFEQYAVGKYTDGLYEDYEDLKSANPDWIDVSAGDVEYADLEDPSANPTQKAIFDQAYDKLHESQVSSQLLSWANSSKESIIEAKIASGEWSADENDPNWAEKEWSNFYTKFSDPAFKDSLAAAYDNVTFDDSTNPPTVTGGLDGLKSALGLSGLDPANDAVLDIELSLVVGQMPARTATKDDYLGGAYASQEFSAYQEYNAVQNGSTLAEEHDNAIEALKNNIANGVVTAEDLAKEYNNTNIVNSVNNLPEFDDGNGNKTKITAEITAAGEIRITSDGAKFGIQEVEGNSTDYTGITEPSKTHATVSNSTKLSELSGLTAGADGRYKFTVNGVDFSFDANATVKDVTSAVSNDVDAKVEMAFSTLDNNFTIKSDEYGVNADVTIDDDPSGVLNYFGFTGDPSQKTAGTNMVIDVNGHEIETQNNSYSVDGTTFTFSDKAVVGETIDVEVKADSSKAKEVIKEFVKDYNELIDFVYGYVDEKKATTNTKSGGSYYFLAPQDIEELGLSDEQEKDWNIAAKKGILNRDSTLSSIMSQLRTSVYAAKSDNGDGTFFSLYDMGITTMSFKDDKHGKLQIDEAKFDEAFDKYGDKIMDLFTNTTNQVADPLGKISKAGDGLMSNFTKIFDDALRQTTIEGDRGSLVRKAGVKGTSYATDNQIMHEIEKINDTIEMLQDRYDKQSDRYWAMYARMESLMGQYNSQTASLSQLMGLPQQ